MRRVGPYLSGLAGLVLLGGLLAGCGGQAAPASHELAMAPLHQMHPDVQAASEAVQTAYQFAVANADILSQIPCFCGCGQLGHKSNYDCYVAGQDASGANIFEPHALTCTICVDITHDTMRMLKEGYGVPDILGFVNQAYLRYGPSNMP